MGIGHVRVGMGGHGCTLKGKCRTLVCWDGLWTLSFGLSLSHGHGSSLVWEVAVRELIANSQASGNLSIFEVTCYKLQNCHCMMRCGFRNFPEFSFFQPWPEHSYSALDLDHVRCMVGGGI